MAAATERRGLVAQRHAELAGLEQREDRLFDRFDNGEIDRETHDRQRDRLRAQKTTLLAELRAAETEVDDAYLHTATTVLELARSAKFLVETRSREEKLALLSRLVCNPRLDGRNVRFDLKKPFAVLARMSTANEWRPQGDSNPC